MKIKRAVAVAFLEAFDFSKASTWDNKKLVGKLNQVPENVDEADVPEELASVYKDIVDSKGQVEIVDTPASEPDADGADYTEEEAAADEGAQQAAEEEVAKAKKSSKKTAPKKMNAEERKSRAKADSDAIQGKTSAKSKAPKDKARSRATKEGIPVDDFGSRQGSVNAKVNKAVTEQWQTEEEIAKLIGLTPKKARRRLYSATRKGLFEHRKLLQYRLLPKKAGKKEVAE